MHFVPEWIEAVVFDLDGVVITTDPDRCFRIWETFSRLSVDEISARYLSDQRYQSYERGEIDIREYLDYLRLLLQLEASDDEIMLGWNAVFSGQIDSSLEQVRRLSATLPCYAFANAIPPYRAVWSHAYSEALDLFEDVFLSCDLGARKPEYAAYRAVADAVDLHLSTMLLFDDSLSHVEGALFAGMQAVHVQTPTDLAHALNKMFAL